MRPHTSACSAGVKADGQEDHQTAHEHSKVALEYSNKAHQRSEEAIKKSAKTAV